GVSLLSRELAGSHQPGYAAFSDSHRHQVLRIARLTAHVGLVDKAPLTVVRLSGCGYLIQHINTI
ncbi:MAG: hypothetical protein CMB79_14595, partial [Filomicrobium sp.]|nr:hypothetical protein [Filomicrobium sp.]